MFPRCGQKATPHHVRWGNVPGGGVSGTPDDYRTVPLCIEHHGQCQRYEKKFFEVIGRDDIMQRGWDLLIDWIARCRVDLQE